MPVLIPIFLSRSSMLIKRSVTRLKNHYVYRKSGLIISRIKRAIFQSLIDNLNEWFINNYLEKPLDESQVTILKSSPISLQFTNLFAKPGSFDTFNFFPRSWQMCLLHINVAKTTLNWSLQKRKPNKADESFNLRVKKLAKKIVQHFNLHNLIKISWKAYMKLLKLKLFGFSSDVYRIWNTLIEHSDCGIEIE